jgi:hypothetical protein
MSSITTPKRLSEIAQSLLYLDGNPFSLKDYPMYETIYDGRYKRTLLMCGRQVAKSTSLANFIITESVSIPFFKEYYVSPSKEQTLIFSNTRVGKTLAYSPIVKKYFQSPEHADRVLHRSYTNGSENAFTYACDDADRARGFSADRVSYDEVQDMLYDAVVPVINACMKNSNYRFETYAGTPKTMEASIQYLWEKSTQSEWVMPCDGCSKYTIVVNEKALGRNGPICLKCGKTLNPRAGFWVDMKKPVLDQKTGKLQELIKGFHIPQPIMPMNIPRCYNTPEMQENAQKRWDDILKDMEMFSASKFRNEVLGVSDAQGRRLISLDDLQKLCVGPKISERPVPENIRDVSRTFAGVDWSGGGTTGVSRTVLWIWGEVPTEQRLRCLYYKVYPGNNAVQDVDHIAQTLAAYNVTMVVGDAGEGHLPNSVLRQRLGVHRVQMARYGSYTRTIMKEDVFLVDRTTLIDNFMMLLKRGGVTYSRDQAQMDEAMKDVLNEFEEVTRAGKKVWHHSPDLPDDCLHAQIFGWFAYRIVIGDLMFYT